MWWQRTCRELAVGSNPDDISSPTLIVYAGWKSMFSP